MIKKKIDLVRTHVDKVVMDEVQMRLYMTVVRLLFSQKDQI